MAPALGRNGFLSIHVLTLGRYSHLKPLTALSVGNKAAKVKTTLLVSMSDFMIISLLKKKHLILLVHNCCNVIMSNEVKQMSRAFLD